MDQVQTNIVTSATCIEVNGDLHALNSLHVFREVNDQFSIYSTAGKKVYMQLSYKTTLVDATEYNSTLELFTALKTKFFK